MKTKVALEEIIASVKDRVIDDVQGVLNDFQEKKPFSLWDKSEQDYLVRFIGQRTACIEAARNDVRVFNMFRQYGYWNGSDDTFWEDHSIISRQENLLPLLNIKPHRINPDATTADFAPGDHVKYVPDHAEKNREHPDCEIGVVSSVDNHYVFVKYESEDTAVETEPQWLVKTVVGKDNKLH